MAKKTILKGKNLSEQIEAPRMLPTAVAASVGVRKFVCCKCGTIYENLERNFPPTNSKVFAGNFGRLPICHRCFNESVIEVWKQNGKDVRKAFLRVCAQWDIYYSDEVGDMLPTGDIRNSKFTQFITLKKTDSDIKTYDDYLLESEALSRAEEVAEAESAITEEETEAEKKYNASAQNINKWGAELLEDDYKFLNAKYAEWENRCDIDSLSREMLVRDLCMLKLQQNKAYMSGNMDLYQKLTDMIQKTLERANLSPKQEEATAKSSEKPIGVLIRQFEEERPIPEPDPEWGDVDGVMKIILVFIIGHLCKMLGLKNRYAKMYEDEMEKYRPSLDDGEDLDTEDIFDQLLESGFAASGVTLTGGDVDDGEEKE